jgi:uncharacterized protein
LELTAVQFLFAALLIFAGSLVQSAVGFGLAIVAAPLLFLIEPRLVPGPILAIALVLSLLNLWKNRAGLALDELGAALVGRIPGMLLALWVLMLAPGKLLSLLIGASVLVAILISLAPIRIRPTRNRLFAAGAVSGFMGTSTSIGGPPMALIYQHDTGDRVRANLSGYFVVSCLMSLMGLAAIGRFGGPELTISLWLLPAATLGFVCGRYAMRWLGPDVVRPALLLLCTIAAVGVLADALW